MNSGSTTVVRADLCSCQDQQFSYIYSQRLLPLSINTHQFPPAHGMKQQPTAAPTRPRQHCPPLHGLLPAISTPKLPSSVYRGIQKLHNKFCRCLLPAPVLHARPDRCTTASHAGISSPEQHLPAPSNLSSPSPAPPAPPRAAPRLLPSGFSHGFTWVPAPLALLPALTPPRRDRSPRCAVRSLHRPTCNIREMATELKQSIRHPTKIKHNASDPGGKINLLFVNPAHNQFMPLLATGYC